MSHTVITTASVESASNINNIKSYFKLPETSFGSRTNPVYPASFTSRIAAGSMEVFDLLGQGLTAPKVVFVKATRPVTVSFISTSNPDVIYKMPPATFVQYVVDTKETVNSPIFSIKVEVPPAAVPAPSPAPQLYPACLVEIFVASTEV